MPKNNEELDLEQIVLALRNAGLQRGKYGIFHYFLDQGADNKEAELVIRKAIKIKPKYLEAYYTLGTILIDLGNLKEAKIPQLHLKNQIQLL